MQDVWTRRNWSTIASLLPDSAAHRPNVPHEQRPVGPPPMGAPSIAFATKGGPQALNTYDA